MNCRLLIVSGLVSLGFVGACSPPSANPSKPLVGGLGKLLVPGVGMDLRLSPDKSWAAFLKDPVKPKLAGVPAHLAVGQLTVAPLSGGPSSVVGTGVTNAAGGYLFSPDSRWLVFLQGFNAANRSGELHVVKLGQASGDSKPMGSSVTFVTVSPDSAWLVFVDAGVLKLAPLGQGVSRELGGEVSTAEFTPDSKGLVYRRNFAAGGGLLLASLTDKASPPVKLGDRVGDYAVASDSAHLAFTQVSPAGRDLYDLYVTPVLHPAPKKVAAGTSVFAFSPDGKWLGRTEGSKPDHLGELRVGPAAGGAGRMIAQGVEEFTYAPNSSAVAALAQYDVASRAGVLYVAGLSEGDPVRLSSLVHSFEWNKDGRFVAFNVRVSHPLPSVDLYLFEGGTEKAFKVEEGVFGFSFSPQGELLRYRSRCTKETRSCELRELELGHPHGAAKTVATDVFSFKSSENGERLLLSYVRSDADAYDSAVLNAKTGQRKTLDERTLLPAYFATPDGSRVLYLISSPARPGLYVSDQAI